ncbi:FAD/FMN_dependent oxidoreductase [Hexamita inflata]|uniref:FAD/FMN dependent oxidoreductase n=1 Tax=Hexamita inflata TaxID=28002 RepID=A0AA86NZA0_9EUKA|nr:FAD/FMN dependent oxidoreductase [Hexamita inflata]
MFNKYTIGNFEVQNRCVRSATATGTCDIVTGILEQKFYDIYESLARGNVGLIIQEHAFVSLKGHADHKQLGIHQDSMIQYHQLANSKMRAANNNIKICSQLAHAGPNCSNENKIEINNASVSDFQIVVQEFKDAAIRAKIANYDCVQIHAGHTYLLSQSISTYYNNRTDEYKASEFKLLKDVLEAIRTVGIPVGVKLQCDDFIEGYSMNAKSACKIIESLQFDFVEVSGGGYTGGAKFGTIRQGKDKYYYQHVIQELKQLNLLNKQPVIVTGGFQNIEDANLAFQDGVPLVGFARKFLRNDQFLIDGDTKKCAKCNQCINGLLKNSEAVCIVSAKQSKLI